MGLWDAGRTGGFKPAKVQQYQWKLDERNSVTLDGNGNGSIQFSPQGAREKWLINFIAVSTTNVSPNSTKVPTMIMYRSAAVPGNQLAGTYNALLDADTTVQYQLNMNEPVVCVFSGGDPASVGNIHLEGIRYVWE
jgi:hypothetical protein